MPRTARNEAAHQDRVSHFFGCAEFGTRDGFGERHTQSIRTPDHLVTFVVYFAAGIFFNAEVSDGELSSTKGNESVHADDSGSLKAGGNGSVEVLLSSDVDLVDDVHIHHKAEFDRDVDSFLID